MKHKVHYVPSTHWDREWYQTFQAFRARLVDLLDDTLDRIASGEYQGPFTTDGQQIMLDDYLEVRPEREEQVREFLGDGRLVAGPWYVMPDEFLVSGEALIRNLRMGRARVRAMGGEPSAAGFVCDIFGHCSQLPQIFTLSNLVGGLIWRGINEIENRELIWEGADGTALVCHMFGRMGYCNFSIEVRGTQYPQKAFNEKDVREKWRKFLKEEAPKAKTQAILTFDGGDHQKMDPDVYRTIFDEPVEGFELVHSTLDKYLTEIKEKQADIACRLQGELREPGFYSLDVSTQYLIPGVGSSRVWIKQANSRCQTLLCHWAEPMAALAQGLLGREYPRGYLDVAWRWLLKNHPHDSICGCSLDEVHEDMKFRFSQCREIGEDQTTAALRALAAQIDTELSDDAYRVVVFNPSPVAQHKVVELDLAIPPEWPKFNEFFGFEAKPAFRLFDAEGKEIPYQRLAQDGIRSHKRLRSIKFPELYKREHVRVAVGLDLPAMGYTTVTLKAGEKVDLEDDDPNTMDTSAKMMPTRHPDTPGLVIADTILENRHIRAEIQADGALSITDKRTNRTYSNLLRFEDCADIGDGWYHGQAVNDERYNSAASTATVSVVQDTPLLSILTIRQVMRVPARFDFDKMRRSKELVDLEIVSRLTLRRDDNVVEVETEVCNTAADHRLRVLLPTNVKADTYWTDTPFDAIERNVALRDDNHLYREIEVESKPQQFWTAISDGKAGLAVVTEGGLLESTVRHKPDRPVALTLYRSTQRVVMTNGQPQGQMLGETLRFRYSILPLNGPVNPWALGQKALEMAAGLRTIQIEPADAELWGNREAPRLAPTLNGLTLSGEVLITSLRCVETGTELRLYNPNAQATNFTVQWDTQVLAQTGWTQCYEVDFESNPIPGGNTYQPDTCGGTLGPKKILTLRWTGDEAK